MARPQGALLDVYDVERVEALRGPQGTLYGKNTIGGALKYVSRPLADEFDARLSLSGGSFAIEGVPPGHYTANAWTPGAQRVSQEIDVQPGAATELRFELLAARVPPHKRKDGSDYPPPGREAQ